MSWTGIHWCCPVSRWAWGFLLSRFLLPIGALLVEDGNTYKDYPDDPAYSPSEGARERRIGATLLAAGILATAATIYGSIKIHSVRKRRRAAELELAAIRALRLVSGSGAPTAASFGADDVAEQVSRQKKTTKLTSRGRRMLTGGVTIGLDSPSGYSRHWNLGLTPGFAYFIAERFAIGASLLVSRQDEALGYGFNRQSLVMGGSVHAIYEARVGANVGLWLWPALGVAWVHNNYHVPYDYDSYSSTQTDFRSTALSFGIAMPLVVHLTESWGLGAGPNFTYWWGTDPNLSRVALSSFLIGSF
ncbi:MAG: hypothetical protein QM778_27890 [Myxococcales bacterium]